MPRYRITVRRTVVTHEVVEIVAHSAASAALKGENYAEELRGASRGVQVVSTFDADTKATETRDVIAVKEV